MRISAAAVISSDSVGRDRRPTRTNTTEDGQQRIDFGPARRFCEDRRREVSGNVRSGGSPKDLVYTGKYRLTDTVKGCPLTVGKLVLSPTRTLRPVVGQCCGAPRRYSRHDPLQRRRTNQKFCILSTSCTWSRIICSKRRCCSGLSSGIADAVARKCTACSTWDTGWSFTSTAKPWRTT